MKKRPASEGKANSGSCRTRYHKTDAARATASYRALARHKITTPHDASNVSVTLYDAPPHAYA